MNWFSLAIAAPILWGFTNVLDATIRRNYVKDDQALMWWTALRQWPLVIILFGFVGFDFPSWPIILGMLVAGVLWVAPFQLYFRAMHVEDPSRIVLFMQLIPIFALLIAWLILGETLNFNQSIGFVLLLAAGFLAAIKKVEGKWHFSVAFIWILTAGFLWALSDVLFKYFTSYFKNYLLALTINFLGMALFSVWQIRSVKHRHQILPYFKGLSKKAWIMLVAAQTIGLIGAICFSYALVLGKASLTTVMLGLQPLFTFLFGKLLSLFIKEIPIEEASPVQLTLKAVSFIIILIGLYWLTK